MAAPALGVKFLSMNDPSIKIANSNNGFMILATAVIGFLHYLLFEQLYLSIGKKDFLIFFSGILILIFSLFFILFGVNRVRHKLFKCQNCKRHIGKLEPHSKEPGAPIYQFCVSCNVLWLVAKVPKSRSHSEGGGFGDSGGGGE